MKKIYKISTLLVVAALTMFLAFSTTKVKAETNSNFTGWIIQTDNQTFVVNSDTESLGLHYSKSLSITYINPYGSGYDEVHYYLFKSIPYGERVTAIGEGFISSGETHRYDNVSGSLILSAYDQKNQESIWCSIQITTNTFKFDLPFARGAIVDGPVEVKVISDFHEETMEIEIVNNTSGEKILLMGWPYELEEEGYYTITARCYVTQKVITTNFTINRTNKFTVMVDPVGAQVGSEVKMNGGAYNSTQMTVGFTRSIYFAGDAPSQSRLDYRFSSSDNSVLSVSAYGTVTGKAPGTATVTIQSKSNPGKVAKVTFNVSADQSSVSRDLVLTTDLRDNKNDVGTEVSSGMGLPGGTTIHVGNTRFMSFLSGNPSDLITDYLWISSNNNIATVSEYGTVTAKSRGIVVITCVNKYNGNFVGQLAFTIL